MHKQNTLAAVKMVLNLNVLNSREKISGKYDTDSTKMLKIN